MARPQTTLFMLMSVDGKISTGDTDFMDVDQDYKNIPGLKEGLRQYYDLERETDLCSLNTGRVFAKTGINEKTDEPEKSPISFVVIDNRPYLTERGVTYLAKKSNKLFIVTTNRDHPAYAVQRTHQNIEIISYEREIDFANLMQKLLQDYGIEKLTVQSGGTLNATFIREGLIDRVVLVVSPALVGGSTTATLMDGESLHVPAALNKIKTLELVKAEPLEESYLLLEYKVKN